MAETDSRIINYEVGQKGLKGNIAMNIEFPSVIFQYKFTSERRFSKEFKIPLILYPNLLAIIFGWQKLIAELSIMM